MKSTILKSFLPFLAGCLIVTGGSLLLHGQSDSEEQRTFSSGDEVYLKSLESLKSMPDVFGDEVTKLQKGTKVRVMKSKDRWLKVSADKKEGWLPKRYVSKKKVEKPESPSSQEQPEWIKRLAKKSYDREEVRNQPTDASIAEETAGTRKLNPDSEENYKAVSDDPAKLVDRMKKLEKMSKFISDTENKTLRQQFAREGNLVWGDKLVEIETEE